MRKKLSTLLCVLLLCALCACGSGQAAVENSPPDTGKTDSLPNETKTPDPAPQEAPTETPEDSQEEAGETESPVEETQDPAPADPLAQGKPTESQDNPEA